MAVDGTKFWKINNITFEDLVETNLLLDALSGKYHLYVSDSICDLLNTDGKIDKYLFE